MNRDIIELALCCQSWYMYVFVFDMILDSKVHGANMGPIWVVLSSPGGPHVGPWTLLSGIGWLLPISKYSVVPVQYGQFFSKLLTADTV